MNFRRHFRHAFTLVEILIVVVILGVLAGIVVPSFIGAVEEASVGTTQSELEKLRRAVDVFQVRNGHALPVISAGDGTWGDLIENNGAYLKEPPINPYIGGENQKVVVLGNGPDAAFQTTHGWIFDDTTGEIWAGGFDGQDQPWPRP